MRGDLRGHLRGIPLSAFVNRQADQEVRPIMVALGLGWRRAVALHRALDLRHAGGGRLQSGPTPSGELADAPVAVTRRLTARSVRMDDLRADRAVSGKLSRAAS